ncbi:hypothetical protein RGE_09910 [Rubrivivax gelatinosus IL144]|uniref:Uncharacterized protein n=1 Tax=Rubrivivax gelatinosus (strain NBRC 100245 / IL144) TaxID=983917 RepID=I0HMU5_RUBGI|nr:hypothetical protein RGE_09910 [Rubrivivax gelatinosus IL144]
MIYKDLIIKSDIPAKYPREIRCAPAQRTAHRFCRPIAHLPGLTGDNVAGQM